MARSIPDWQAVLRLLYDREITPGPGGFAYDFGELTDAVTRELRISPDRAEKILLDMRDFGLLTAAEYNDATSEERDTVPMYGLSERGFDVEVQHRQTEAQEETNRFLAVFTAALVMIALTEALATAPTASPGASTVIRVSGAVVVVAILVVVWYQTR